MRGEDDDGEDAEHRELLGITDRRGDAGAIEPPQQRRVPAEREERGEEAEEQHQAPPARPHERAPDREGDDEEADVDAEEERRSHPGVQPARPVPHHAVDGEMAEDIGEDQLAVLRPRHAPSADQVEIKRPGAGRIVHVIDGGEELRRADQRRRPGEERDPQHARDRLRRAWRGVPAAIERVQAEEQSGLHDGGRLRHEELHAEEERAEGEVAHAPPQQKPPDEETRQRQPGGAEEDRQEVDVGEIEAAESPGRGAEPRRKRTQLHRAQQRVHADQAEVDVDEDVQPEPEVVARQEDQPGQWIEDLMLRIRGDCHTERVPSPEHDNRDRDEPTAGRHTFRKGSRLRQHERAAGGATHGAAEQHGSHLQANLLLLGRREYGDDAVDGFHRV